MANDKALRFVAGAAALLLAGCGSSTGPDTGYHLTATDTRFVQPIRVNTQTFFSMSDADLAAFGHGVCDVLRAGGVVTQAGAILPGAPTNARGKLDLTTVAGKDALYFANLARQDYCPQYPAVKLAPNG